MKISAENPSSEKIQEMLKNDSQSCILLVSIPNSADVEFGAIQSCANFVDLEENTAKRKWIATVGFDTV